MKLDKLLAPQLFYFKERFLCPPSNTQYTRTRHKIGFKHIYINRIDAEDGGTLGYDTEGVSGKTPENVSFKIAALNLNAVRIFLVEAEIK